MGEMTILINVEIWGNRIILQTHEGLFSPNHADKGTLTMLKYVELKPDDKVLDLGCGYGIVGIAAAKVIGGSKVFMVDCDRVAVKISKENAVTNGVPDVTVECGNGVAVFKHDDFSLILSNPPYHTDFSIARSFIELGFKQLKLGGMIILVVKRLDWYKNKLISVFGGVKVIEDDGYYVLISEKMFPGPNKVKPKTKTTTRKHLKKIGRTHEKIKLQAQIIRWIVGGRWQWQESTNSGGIGECRGENCKTRCGAWPSLVRRTKGHPCSKMGLEDGWSCCRRVFLCTTC